MIGTNLHQSETPCVKRLDMTLAEALNPNKPNQTLHEMARLLIDLRKTSEKPSAALEDFIDPRLFAKVVDSAKNISGFDRNDHSMAIPVTYRHACS